MDAKHIKFLQLFSELAKVKVDDIASMETKLVPIIKLDFCFGLDIWEYLSITNEEAYTKNVAMSEFLGNRVLELFFSFSSQKTIYAVESIDAIAKFVFCYNPHADKGIPLDIVLNALVTNKIDLANFVLSNVQKNNRVSFDNYLKTIVEHCIVVHIKKLDKSTKNMPFPKKQANLLLEYIAKVRGPNRALLEQRLKEVS
ncbi:MAG: hypothetical protein LBU60_05015 [Clostridiales bacterium]|jgi:hypothetical protein|nr:hypothetical protein [Clostridiales bacterium]